MPFQLFCKQTIILSLLSGFIGSLSVLVSPGVTEARPLGSPKGNSSTGAVRGACPALDTKLQNRKLLALVDAKDPSLTTQARPTFWMYLPFTRTEDITTAEFELFDENMSSVLSKAKITVPLPNKAGLARFTLPSQELQLTPEKEYFWVFRVVCDKDDRSGNPTVSGWIKRVTPEATLVNRLKSIPQADQYKLFAEKNIWFDQISLLAQYSTQHSQEWTKLLTAFGLQSIAQQAVIELKSDTK